MKTIVLDDDPTGTQSATGVTVLLEWTTLEIVDALKKDHAVYLQTNSRALEQEDAVSLARDTARQIAETERVLGEPVQIVLRGDSTLRGHVFAESDVFVTRDSPILFVPAFPEGGRRTINATHLLDIEGVPTPVGETEYASDPVFGFTSSSLVDFTREKGARKAWPLPLATLRDDEDALVNLLQSVTAGDTVVPDVENDDDIDLIAHAVRTLQGRGGKVVVRSAAPLAAALAGKTSREYLGRPVSSDQPTLVLCGSHTSGASSQLDRLEEATGWERIVIDTESAYTDAAAEGERVAELVRERLAGSSGAIVCTQRHRRSQDNTLEHGRQVMKALVTVAERCRSLPHVITKGGITSAEVIKTGLGATHADVLGQIAPGISVWRAQPSQTMVIVVPGNVGGPGALVDAVNAFDITTQRHGIDDEPVSTRRRA